MSGTAQKEPRKSREELFRKALSCTTAAQLQELAAEHGLELKEQEAEELLNLVMSKAGDLSDSERDLVTGGGKAAGGGCPRCKSKNYVYWGTGNGWCIDCDYKWTLWGPYRE